MGQRQFGMVAGDLSALAHETGSRSLLSYEARKADGEIELFKRLQAKNSEVDGLKKEMAALIEQHAIEKNKLTTLAVAQINETSSAAGDIIEQNQDSMESLSLQMQGLITNGAKIVDELQSKFITGSHFPNRLPPHGNCEPRFKTPFGRPDLPVGAQNLGNHTYEKLSKVVKASKAPLPGDQTILQSMRGVVRFVLQLREQVSWGDYVRPSMQHIEGPHVGVFSALHNPGQALDISERSELEALAAQQDTMHDPLGVSARSSQLQHERAAELAQFDAALEDIECKERPELQHYRARVTAHIDQVRTEKEIDASRRDSQLTLEKKQLQELQQMLHEQLKCVADKIIDINEQQVNKESLLVSLKEDEEAAAVVQAEIDAQEATLETYEGYLKQRKAAVTVMGQHEVEILSHIEDLLIAGSSSLFEGTQPMLMRQFEVLPA